MKDDNSIENIPNNGDLEDYRRKVLENYHNHISGIICLKDLEDFSNKYQIPMHYSQELPGAFQIVIFKRDEQFVRSMLDENIGAGILVNYKVLPDNFGNDKVQLIKRMRG